MHCFGVFCRVCLEPKGNMTHMDGFCDGIHIGEMIFAVKKELVSVRIDLEIRSLQKFVMILSEQA